MTNIHAHQRPMNHVGTGDNHECRVTYRHHDAAPDKPCLSSPIKMINGVPATAKKEKVHVQNKEMDEIIPLGKRAHNLRSIMDKTDGYDQTLDKYLTEGEFSGCNINVGTNEHIRAVATYYVMGNCGATNDREAISMELDTRSDSLNNQDICLKRNNQKHVHWQRQNRYFHVTTMDIQCVNAPSDCHVKINCAR